MMEATIRVALYIPANEHPESCMLEIRTPAGIRSQPCYLAEQSNADCATLNRQSIRDVLTTLTARVQLSENDAPVVTDALIDRLENEINTLRVANHVEFVR
jgi:hypothetical protein